LGLHRTPRPLTKPLSRVARAYVTAVIVAGAVLFAVCLPFARVNEPVLFAILLVLSSATAVLKVQLPFVSSDSTMSVSYAVDFASLMLLGPHATMVVAAVSGFCQCHLKTRVRTPAYRTLFSIATLVLAVEGAGLAFRLLGGQPFMELVALAAPLVGAAGVYFLINTLLVAGAIALSTDSGVIDTWQRTFLWSAPSYFVGAGSAALTVWVTWRFGYWMVPLTFAPIYLTYRTYKVYIGRIEDERRHVQQTSDLHLATIEALARAIDAKDQPTQSHIRRVQLYAAGLARAIGLSVDEIQGVKTAALLHDIGKLAVPEHILSKPGPLTQEEFQKIRIHPQVGAEIIAAVPFPYPVAPLILSHHERWDGKGYPQGLAGDQIPIGARILTIVDYYDAVTTNRPYHHALSSDSAVAMLKHEAGRALDPSLVGAFIEMLPSLVLEYRGTEPAVETAPETVVVESAEAAVRPAPMRNDTFEKIALAHREIYALYEIAQAMGTSLGVADTMALISAKLSKLVPWSGCALFLYDAGTERLQCRFAAGIDAPRLLDTSIAIGDGPAGWVAKNRRSIITADPHGSFRAAGISDPTVLKSAIVSPLYFEDGFIGCLALYHTTPDYYVEDHRRLLDRVSEQAGAVIHNSIVFERTQEDSLTDPLTGLPNRRSMFVHMSRELSRAGRLDSSVALIVMDVDRFKAINDTYGHNVGDAALRSIAQALRESLRPYDLCVRYAGDEFIVVLSDCAREAAEAKRSELQARIGQIELPVRPGRMTRLAVSAGVAVFPADGTTSESLLAEADARMYRNKAVRRGDIPMALPAAPSEFLAPELFERAEDKEKIVPLPEAS
jgi:diguanylate cyclase (GGDEF)-like protein/putative nucleotidyltransferase with HDIG domain